MDYTFIKIYPELRNAYIVRLYGKLKHREITDWIQKHTKNTASWDRLYADDLTEDNINDSGFIADFEAIQSTIFNFMVLWGSTIESSSDEILKSEMMQCEPDRRNKILTEWATEYHSDKISINEREFFYIKLQGDNTFCEKKVRV